MSKLKGTRVKHEGYQWMRVKGKNEIISWSDGDYSGKREYRIVINYAEHEWVLGFSYALDPTPWWFCNVELDGVSIDVAINDELGDWQSQIAHGFAYEHGRQLLHDESMAENIMEFFDECLKIVKGE